LIIFLFAATEKLTLDHRGAAIGSIVKTGLRELFTITSFIISDDLPKLSVTFNFTLWVPLVLN
jgi:hypothetical protein